MAARPRRQGGASCRLRIPDSCPKKLDVSIAFEGDDVGGDAVQKPTIVGDDQHRAGKLPKGVFQGAQGFDVEIVGGLVQEEQVTADKRSKSPTTQKASTNSGSEMPD